MNKYSEKVEGGRVAFPAAQLAAGHAVEGHIEDAMAEAQRKRRAGEESMVEDVIWGYAFSAFSPYATVLGHIGTDDGDPQ